MNRVLCLLAAVSMSACSMFGGDDDAVEASDTPTVTSLAAQPIEDVRVIEIGRTRDGIVVTAYGIAPGIGYSLPRLEPRRGGRLGTDGFLDFDFVADPPDPGFALPKGQAQARILRADRLLSVDLVRQALGIRVHGANGGQQLAF